MRVSDFGEIETELLRRVERIVWCTTATQMPDGRLRSRILHPIWEGSRAWVATGRHDLLRSHSARAQVVQHTPARLASELATGQQSGHQVRGDRFAFVVDENGPVGIAVERDTEVGIRTAHGL